MRLPLRSKYRFSIALLMFSGLGRPSRSRAIQSYILNVKMYGVVLISRTRLLRPELWRVPGGIRYRPCFTAGSALMYFGTSSGVAVSWLRVRAASNSSGTMSSLNPR